MQIHAYSAAGTPDKPNEDYVLCGANWAVVLDGAGPYPGVDYGCVHSTVWVVEHLAGHLAAKLAVSHAERLPDVLAAAIRATMTDHGPQCDLNSPFALAATVAIVRIDAGQAEWLVLGDTAVVLQHASGAVEVTTDDRLERLPNPPVTDAEVRTYEPSYVRKWRNMKGGFWVAGAVPEAAYQALCGSAPVSDIRRILLASDGITRLAERYSMPWASLVDSAAHAGLAALVTDVRCAELDDPEPRRWRGRRHDDVAAVLLQT